MFLSFVNFYRKFIYRYSKIIESLIDLFKDSKSEKKLNFFEWFEFVELIYRYFRDIFTLISLLIYFDF